MVQIRLENQGAGRVVTISVMEGKLNSSVVVQRSGGRGPYTQTYTQAKGRETNKRLGLELWWLGTKGFTPPDPRP